jgi:hypothetical protein
MQPLGALFQREQHLELQSDQYFSWCIPTVEMSGEMSPDFECEFTLSRKLA